MGRLVSIVMCAAFLMEIMPATAQKFDTKQLYKDIATLADDDMLGRESGSPSEKKAAQYIAGRYFLLGLEPKGTEGYYQPFDFYTSNDPHGSEDSSDSERVHVNATNVIGYLNRQKPYTIVIGAHFDHLGMGEMFGSLDPNGRGQVHNGADDNASGVAGLLALAESLSAKKDLQYNVLFIAFSGEEEGLQGSKFWCKNPTLSLESLSYMFNMDMIGRLGEEKKLMIFGVGTANEWVTSIQKLKTDLKIIQDSSGVGPSDQTSFYLKKIPVLHFFTGQHKDYHKPSDDVSKINLEGEAQVLGVISQLIDRNNSGAKLDFHETRNPDMGSKTSFKVTLGIMPDYTYVDGGLRIDGVSEGRPAAKAGLREGDIIIQIGDFQIGGMEDYMQVLRSADKGINYPSFIMRDGKKMPISIIF